MAALRPGIGEVNMTGTKNPDCSTKPIGNAKAACGKLRGDKRDHRVLVGKMVARRVTPSFARVSRAIYRGEYFLVITHLRLMRPARPLIALLP